MLSRLIAPAPTLPAGFLEWQVHLRAHTATERNGAPHAGVAPLLLVRRPGAAAGVSAHSIICGILQPIPGLIPWKAPSSHRPSTSKEKWSSRKMPPGKAEGCAVVHFRHESTWNTRFGQLELMTA